MEISYYNGSFLPREEIHISPDDRGFLFADGVYEVARWYEGFFYDMEGHMARLKRSLRELRIEWPEADKFPAIAHELIKRNSLEAKPVLVYLQVTRGSARRSHAFPVPAVPPTVYAFARSFRPDPEKTGRGIQTIMKKENRWSRCDIKSVSLLPNILSFQEAVENSCHECIFVRDGFVTECAHSNIFFVIDGILRTHPESEHILSGISRKNILRLASENGIPCRELAVSEPEIEKATEAFISNTSYEVAPVTMINGRAVGDGKPGPVAARLRILFDEDLRKERVLAGRTKP
jgi:D-alanine transaminase